MGNPKKKARYQVGTAMGEKIPKNPYEFPVPGSINLGVVVTKLFEKAKKVGALTKITR